MPAAPPSLSITLSTTRGWSEAAAAIRSADAAAARVGGELVVTDSSGEAVPDLSALPSTRWHAAPGLSVFQLRRLGYQLAGAPIVAVTEDHCWVYPDWGERLLATFAEHPDAVAVGGSVENGATGSIVDWAAYFVGQASVASPMPSGRVDRLSGAVNVAYRAEVLQHIDDHEGLGASDAFHQRDLAKGGAALVMDDSIRVVHDQSLELRTFTALQFHAARTFGGFQRKRMDVRAFLHFLAVAIAPPARLVRMMALLRGRGHGRILWRAWPAMLWFLYVQAAGYVLGVAGGPGDSPNRVM